MLQQMFMGMPPPTAGGSTLSTGLAYAFLFAEPDAGDNRLDAIGPLVMGDVHASVTRAAGMVGGTYAASFNGTDSVLRDAVNMASVAFTATSFTADCWYYQTSNLPDSTEVGLITKNDDNVGLNWWLGKYYNGVNESLHLQIKGIDDSVVNEYVGIGAPVLNTWQYAQIRYDFATGKINVRHNNSISTLFTHLTGVKNNGAYFNFGAVYGNAGFFPGLIFNPCGWTRPLSDAEGDQRASGTLYPF